MEYLLFDLIQNFKGEYPKLSPHMVIKLADKEKQRKGFGVCSELGMTNYLASQPEKRYSLFRPFDKDTELAFIGERVLKNGLIFLKVTEDESYENEIDRLINEYKPLNEEE